MTRTVRLPNPPDRYDPRDQREMRRLIEQVINRPDETSTSLATEYNVLDYGALGNWDGSTGQDDTTYIQAALTAAGDAGGGVVKIPAGTYKVTGTLTTYSNVTIRGEGSGSIVNATGMTGLHVFYGAYLTNVVVEQFAIQGTHCGGVALGGCTQVTIQQMVISGATTSLPITGYGAGIHVWGCTDVIIDSNYLSGNGLVSETTQVSDIICNGLDQYGYKRHSIRNNHCLSTAAYVNICGFNLQESEISGNECSGAKVRPIAQNGGYGILLYAAGYLVPWSAVTAYIAGDVVYLGTDQYDCILANTNQTPPNATYWTLIDHSTRDNRVANNNVHDVEGIGIYTASARRTIINGNLVARAATAQSEGSLPASGIGIAGGGASVTNNRIITSGKSGIVFAAPTEVSICTSNTIQTCSGFAGIHLRGDCTGIRISDNDVQSCTGVGIGSTDAAWTMLDIAVLNNRITSSGSHGVMLTRATNCTVGDNTIKLAGGHGIYDEGVFGTNTAITGNVVVDSGQLTASTYSNIAVQSPQTAVSGNVTGNTIADGAIYGVFVDATAVLGSTVTANTGNDNRTADFNLAFGTASGGNVDTANTGAFTLGPVAELSVQGTLGTQLLMGNASVIGSVGTTYSQGDSFLATNAGQVAVNTDNWHQHYATVPSWLLVLKNAGDVELYTAVAGKADGTFAAFWGSPETSWDINGAMKIAGTYVVKAQGAAVADVANTDATDLASAILVANECKVQLNAWLARARAATGHGLIA